MRGIREIGRVLGTNRPEPWHPRQEDYKYMMGKTHKVGGILAGLVVSKFFFTADFISTGIYTVSLMSGSILGSLLPDIDKKESTIGRVLWFISWPIYLLRMILKLLTRILPGLIKKPFMKLDNCLAHRGIAHSILTWLSLSACLWFGQSFINITVLSWVKETSGVETLLLRNGIFAFSCGVSIGMISHIFLDLFTDDGEALLLPISNFKFKIPLIKTGGFLEVVVRYAMIIASLLVAKQEFYNYFSWRKNI